jgi:DNA polymerase-1
VIDGDAFVHRAYHALPKSIRGRNGRPAGAIVGFSNYLIRLWEDERPRCVLVAWDTLGSPTYRHRALPEYQGGRVFDRELVEQLDALPEFVTSFGFINAKAAGYEADDFLASAATREERRGGTALIATSDRDAFQLVSNAVTVLQPGGGTMTRIGPAEVLERYGVKPKQVPDFIALRGDPSDRIPGAQGVGAKTAASLLRRYEDLEAILAAGRFSNQAVRLRLYRSIATMDRKAPLPPLRAKSPTWSAAGQFAGHWGLEKLAQRLSALA